jgi:hypothetical protein
LNKVNKVGFEGCPLAIKVEKMVNKVLIGSISKKPNFGFSPTLIAIGQDTP